MATIILFSVPEFSRDYKNVADFTSVRSRDSWLAGKKPYRVETNAKIDNFLTNLVINQPITPTLREKDYLKGITSDNREAFYFILNREQLTPSTTRLTVELDVWQTYLFEMKLYPSMVERMHVPRWNADGTPIRTFIEETNSQGGSYQLKHYTTVSAKEGDEPANPRKGCYVFATTTPIGAGTGTGSGTGGGGTGGCGNPELGIPSPSGFLFIKGYEGLAQYAHNIGDGVMTIGYGCTDAYDLVHFEQLKANEPVSDSLASDVMAESLVSGYGVPLKNQLKGDGVTVTANEFDALLSFVYNAGLGSLIRSSFYAQIKAGNKAEACELWLTTNIMAGSSFEAGLRSRRQAEVNIFKSSQYELRTITIYGQGGVVVGSLEAKDSHVPTLISNECQKPSGEFDCYDERGNGWFYPVGGIVSAVFPNYSDGTYHGAIDIAGNNGATIYPPRAGMKVVNVAYSESGYGNYCVLEDTTTQTRHWFGHMQTRPSVSVGQVVELNTPLGVVGSTGNSTGPHCHWEIRVAPNYTYGESINPAVGLTVGSTIERGI